MEANVNQRLDALAFDSKIFPLKFSSSRFWKSAIVSGNSFKSLLSSDNFLFQFKFNFHSTIQLLYFIVCLFTLDLELLRESGLQEKLMRWKIDSRYQVFYMHATRSFEPLWCDSHSCSAFRVQWGTRNLQVLSSSHSHQVQTSRWTNQDLPLSSPRNSFLEINPFTETVRHFYRKPSKLFIQIDEMIY